MSALGGRQGTMPINNQQEVFDLIIFFVKADSLACTINLVNILYNKCYKLMTKDGVPTEVNCSL